MQPTDPGLTYQDSLTAFHEFCDVTVDYAAIRLLTPPYQSAFFPELNRPWTPLSDDELRTQLLSGYSVEEVDGYFARRDEARRERDRQLAWEATFRGKATMAWRGFRRESSWRVSTAWTVLRHGKTEDDE